MRGKDALGVQGHLCASDARDSFSISPTETIASIRATLEKDRARSFKSNLKLRRLHIVRLYCTRLA